MKLKKIKWGNIFLLFVACQFVIWCFKGLLNYNCIIYYAFIFIIYNAIKYIRRYKED